MTVAKIQLFHKFNSLKVSIISSSLGFELNVKKDTPHPLAGEKSLKSLPPVVMIGSSYVG